MNLKLEKKKNNELLKQNLTLKNLRTLEKLKNFIAQRRNKRLKQRTSVERPSFDKKNVWCVHQWSSDASNLITHNSVFIKCYLLRANKQTNYLLALPNPYPKVSCIPADLN